jgi:hypothetical protein
MEVSRVLAGEEWLGSGDEMKGWHVLHGMRNLKNIKHGVWVLLLQPWQYIELHRDSARRSESWMGTGGLCSLLRKNKPGQRRC